MSTKISIITVVYNAEATIERTIKSVLSQNYENIEYIIIDGGSTDNTLAIIESYKDSIFYYHSKKDKGIYDAMNQGIAVATGDYIGLINADDWLEDNAVEVIVNNILINPDIDIFHANINFIIDGQSKISKPTKNLSRFFWRGMLYMHPTYYVKSHVYKKLKYDVKYKLLSDYKFTMECFNRKVSFFHIDKVLVNFTYGGASSVLIDRIVEGHKIRMELGFKPYKVYLSTMLRIALSLASIVKQQIKSIYK